MEKQKLGPIYLGSLLPKLDHLLIDFLENLSLSDWERQTLAPKWKVRDVALHLLDGNLRALSMLRDGFFGEKPESIHTYKDLVDFLNTLNAIWVKAGQRLSPPVIIDLLKSSGMEYCEYINTLDPEAPATFSVAWAGEKESQNWFHIAREYTEKWHHQQQIRHATGQERELLQPQWFQPYLETSLRALPYHYRDVKAEPGCVLCFVFQGMEKKHYFLHFEDNHWELLANSNSEPACVVTIHDEDAWKIFTKGIQREEAIQRSPITGDRDLGLQIFDLIAVMG